MASTVSELHDDHFLDIEALVSAPYEADPPTPCELLDPVMRGIMAKELADIVLPNERKVLEKQKGGKRE